MSAQQLLAGDPPSFSCFRTPALSEVVLRGCEMALARELHEHEPRAAGRDRTLNRVP
jgi:hypothetical protein